jgi:hypothetical protein
MRTSESPEEDLRRFPENNDVVFYRHSVFGLAQERKAGGLSVGSEEVESADSGPTKSCALPRGRSFLT